MYKSYFLLVIFILLSSDLFACKVSFVNGQAPFNKKFNLPQLHNYEVRQNGLSNYADSESGNFRVHYDTEGINAVASVDFDNNGVPDYVDSTLIFADYTYDHLINVKNWKIPSKDDDDGGSDAYDIYILEIGKNEESYGIYGYVQPEDLIYDENQEAIGIKTFMVIDNNFSSLDSAYNKITKEKYRSYYTFGYEALKSTIAHEFHHQIQFNYLQPASNKLFEMTSVFIERNVFPESKDYIQYVGGLFDKPSQYFLASSSQNDGYVMGLFWDFINERFGSDRIIRRTWELIGELDTNELEVINQAIISETETHDLDLAFCEFVKWCYNASEGRSPSFDQAVLYPELSNLMDTSFSDQNINFTSDLPPYSFSLAKFTFPEFQETTDDSLHVLFSNSNLDNAINFGDKKSLFGFQVGTINTSNKIILEEINQEVEIVDFDEVFCYELLEYPGVSSIVSGKTFPMPFKLNKHQFIYFEVPNNTLLYDDLDLQILNFEMQVIYSDRIESSYFNSPQLEDEFGSGVRVAQLDINLLKDPKPGVYFYQIINNDKSVMGKFVITK